jgi:hypothetical protein
MSIGKLNYESLNEEFCHWYYKYHKVFPNKSMHYEKEDLINKIHLLKRGIHNETVLNKTIYKRRMHDS